MNGVYLISRHRQWRAWQFGMRHSGAMRGASGGGKDPESRLKAAKWVLGYVVVMLVMMFVWPTVGGYMLAGFVIAGILGWIAAAFL